MIVKEDMIRLDFRHLFSGLFYYFFSFSHLDLLALALASLFCVLCIMARSKDVHLVILIHGLWGKPCSQNRS